MIKITSAVSKEDEEKFEQQLLKVVSESFLKKLLKHINNNNLIYEELLDKDQ